MSAISVLVSPKDEAVGARIKAALARRGHALTDESHGDRSADQRSDGETAIVVWSKATRKLAALQAQAQEALERGALIPIAVDGAGAPDGFETMPPVDLSGWRGDDGDPRWRFVLEEIELTTRRGQIADADPWRADPSAPATPARAPDLFDHAATPGPEPHGDDFVFGDLLDEHATDPGQTASPPLPAASDAPRAVSARRRMRARKFDPAAVAVGGLAGLAAAALLAALGGPALDALRNEPAPAAADRIAFNEPVFQRAGTQDGESDEPPLLATVRLEPPAMADAAAEANARSAQDAQALTPVPPQVAPEVSPSIIASTPSAEAPLAGAATALPDGIDAGPRVDEQPDIAPTAALTAAVNESADESGPSERDAAQMDSLIASLIDADDAPPPLEALADEALPTEDDIIAALEEGDIDPLALPEITGRTEYAGDFFRECVACPDMRAMPVDAFLMGAPADEPAASDAERPQVFVEFERPFAIATREVTYAQWDACVDDGGCNGYRPPDWGWGRGDQPVTGVSFEDAQSFAAWLSDKTGANYRLPSEAEWEFAARGGADGAFHFGDALSPEQANYDARYAYHGRRGAFRARTVPVASFSPNRFGIFDMHGNAWEWTADCWAPSHEGAPTDGSPRAGVCGERVLKGGAFNTGGWRLRAAHRLQKTQGARERDNGFRVARDL